MTTAAAAPISVPLVDIGPFMHPRDHNDADRAACALDWDRAMSDIGFAFIIGHGIDGEDIQNLRSGSAAFFARDVAYKESFRQPYGSPLGGYEGLGEQAISAGADDHGGLGDKSEGTVAPDPVESYVCSRGDPANWGVTLPQQPQELSAAAAKYHAGMRRVLDGLNSLTAAALGLPPTYFDPLFSPSPTCILVAKHYPGACNTDIRFGAHTDYQLYTVLKPHYADWSTPDAGGLEVLLKDRSTWLPVVVPREDAFVVNIGDLYEDMTNGRWSSTVHRVRAPKAGSAATSQARLSIAFFTGPHDDALVETIPSCVDNTDSGDTLRLSQRITAGEHLQTKILATFKHRAKL